MSDFRGLDLTVIDDDIVMVMRDIYAKTPEAATRVVSELAAIGYAIKRGEHGDNYYFGSLENIRFAKCGSCNEYISPAGSQVHGHKCEKCGAVVFEEIIDGTYVRFEFADDGEEGFFTPQLSMKANRWDVDAGYLYLYYGFTEGSSFSVVTGAEAEAYLQKNIGKWEIVTESEQKLLKVRCPMPRNGQGSDISVHDIRGYRWNHKTVKLWKGKEYSEYGDFPIPDMISVKEAWHWMPLERSPRLHEKIMSACGQVSDKGYYYQDGRAAISESLRDEFYKYIHHFTVLLGDEFLQRWPGMRKSGPGFIEDLAKFCHEKPEITDAPNAMNLLLAMSKVATGNSLTAGEMSAAIKGLDDQPQSEIVVDLFRSRDKRK